jgi:hypothetical protein
MRTPHIRACGPVVASAAELVRCTATDGTYSFLTRGPCKAPTDTRTPVAATAPLMKRDDRNTGLIRCTSRDGKKVSIQRGNCESPDDYQQPLSNER